MRVNIEHGVMADDFGVGIVFLLIFSLVTRL